MVTAIAFFVYPVSEMARARHFYEQVLRLKLASNFRDEWLEYEAAGATFAITTMDVNHQPGAPGGVVAFEVDDLDAEVRRLKALQAPLVRDVFATPICRMAVVADPDGNHVIIHQRNP